MLRVWLPLDGNLENYGLSEIALTSGTPKYTASGKIGTALDLSSKLIYNCPDLTGATVWSVAFWARVDDDASITTNWQDIIGFYDKTQDDSTQGSFRAETCYGSASTGIHWHDNAVYAITSGGLPTHYVGDRGIWHHCAMVVDSNNYIKGYTDGQQIGDYTTSAGGHLTGAFWIGETNNIAGAINDIRIYDHALSPKEIQLLSRGLMLHYTLSAPGNENLNREQISSSKWISWAGAVLTTREKIEINGKIWAHVVQGSESSGSGYGGYTCGPADNKIEIDATKQYTLSVLAKRGTATNSIIRLWCHWRSSEGGANLAQNVIDIPLTKDIQRVSVTWTAPTNDTYTVNRINLMIGSAKPDNELYFTDIKFEEGTKPTPWMPNPEDEIYSKLGYDDTTEYDVSGYKHNGTQSGVTHSPDSPKYLMSTYFNREIQSCIKYTDLNFKSGIWSVSIWYYYNAQLTDVFDTIFSLSRNNGTDANKKMAIMIKTSYLWYKTENGSVSYSYSKNLLQNQWNHFVLTSDGATGTLYLNGAQVKTCSITSLLEDCSDLVLGCRSKSIGATTVAFPMEGKLSDFRIYATALSPEAVLELYHTAATLSSNGVLMTNEFVEG